MQLFPALVEAVEWLEEGDRIRDVDEHRHIQFAGGLPHGIEPLVIDRDQLAFVVAQVQAERLPHLQAARTHGYGLAQALRLGLAEVAVGREVLVINAREDREAVRIGLLVAGQLLLQALAELAIQVDHRLHAGSVHRLQELSDRALAEVVFLQWDEGVSQVIVRVDHREARLRDLCHRRGEHGTRLKIAEEQIELT